MTPMLIIIMFGSFELGNYFLSEHAVLKAVRDGARYAGRQPFSNYVCDPAPANPIDPGGSVLSNTQNLVRTGQLVGGSPRLSGWTDASTIKVKYECPGTVTGIYQNNAGGAPVVTVSASVPYSSILGRVGLSGPNLSLNGNAQSAVTGL